MACASRSSSATARGRLLPTSVSTNCFQEMGWESKQALMKNSLVKNVFLGQLDYFVLERRGREMIKTASLHSSLGFGDADAMLAKGPVWGCPIALLFLSSPPFALCCCGSKSICCRAAPLQPCAAPASALPAPGFGDRGSHLVPIMKHPWKGHPALVLSSRQMQPWLHDEQQPWGFGQG